MTDLDVLNKIRDLLVQKDLIKKHNEKIDQEWDAATEKNLPRETEYFKKARDSYERKKEIIAICTAPIPFAIFALIVYILTRIAYSVSSIPEEGVVCFLYYCIWISLVIAIVISLSAFNLSGTSIFTHILICLSTLSGIIWFFADSDVNNIWTFLLVLIAFIFLPIIGLFGIAKLSWWLLLLVVVFAVVEMFLAWLIIIDSLEFSSLFPGVRFAEERYKSAKEIYERQFAAEKGRLAYEYHSKMILDYTVAELRACESKLSS